MGECDRQDPHNYMLIERLWNFNKIFLRGKNVDEKTFL